MDEHNPLKLPVKRKRSVSVEVLSCVICRKKDCGKSTFVKSPTEYSISSLVTSAKLRKDDVYDRLAAEFPDLENNKEIFYHRICHQKYTSATNLKTFRTKDAYEPQEKSDIKSLRSSSQFSAWNKCISICKNLLIKEIDD